MANIKIEKVLNVLPTTVDPDTFYLVKKNQGIDCYISNNTGNETFLLNKANSVPNIARNNSYISVDNVFVNTESSMDFIITNYDSFTNYTVSAISGSVTISGDTISYIAPATIQPTGIILNGKTYNFTMVPNSGVNLGNVCLNNDKMVNYSDGNGGSISEPLEINSVDCGYVPTETVTGILVNDTFTDAFESLIENHKGEVGASWITAGQRSGNNSVNGPCSNLKLINNQLTLYTTGADLEKRYSISPLGGSLNGLTNFTLEYGVKFNPITPFTYMTIRVDQTVHPSLINNSFPNKLLTMYRYNDPTGLQNLHFKIANSSTQHFLNSGTAVLSDVEFIVKAEFTETFIKIYVDDVLLATEGNPYGATPFNTADILVIDFGQEKLTLNLSSLIGNSLTYFKLSTIDSVVRQKNAVTILDKFVDPVADFDSWPKTDLTSRSADSRHTWKRGTGYDSFILGQPGMCRSSSPSSSSFMSAFCFQEMPVSDYYVELDINVLPLIDSTHICLILKTGAAPDRLDGYADNDFIAVDFFPDAEASSAYFNTITYNMFGGDNTLLDNSNDTGIRLIAPSYAPYYGKHTLRCEVVGTLLVVLIDGVIVQTKQITSLAAIRKGWVGFAFKSDLYSWKPTIDISEFRAGVIA